MKFFVFRHGQTDWNKESRIQGSTNTELNEQGRKEASGLIPLMRELSPQIIVSSDLNRAFDTGQIVAQALSIPILREPRLREANFGEAEGMTVPDIVEKWGKKMWEDFRRINPDYTTASFPGGETRGDSVLRMRTVVDEIRAKGKYERVALSTHGGVVRNLLHSYLPPERESLPIPNCVTYLLEFTGDKVKVEGPLSL